MKNYLIADVPVAMTCKYGYTEKMCRDYERNDGKEAQIYIEVSEEEIAAEGTLEERERRTAYLESLALYRKLCEKMLDYDTFLMHCSAVAVDGKAYLFAAPSGTGKSTHTRLWREVFGERAVMINDDKPLIQVKEDAIYVCGTPWCGKHGLNSNQKAPIQGICILERGKENFAERISAVEGFSEVYKQTYHPREKRKMIKTISLLKMMIERIPVYRMQCTISTQAVDAAWNAMKPQE